MVDFAKLRERSGKKDSIAERAAALEKLKNRRPAREVDTRFWTPTRGPDGNGSAIIRFLPEFEDDVGPWVQVFDHWFKGPSGKIFDGKSLVSINQECPINQHYWKMKNSDSEADQALAEKISRRVNYYSNIYVVKDPLHPENEGKVFLYRYGTKIFSKVMDLLNPGGDEEGADELVEKVDPFDLWSGANFLVKTKTIKVNNKDMPSYDNSKFLTPGPLLDDDEELKRIWSSQTSLKEFIDPTTFGTYDSVRARLADVLGVPVETVGGRSERKDESTVDAPKAKPVTAVSKDIEVSTVKDSEIDALLEEFK